MSLCQIKGCRNEAKYVRRSVTIRLPGHPVPVEVGDLNLCPPCERTTRVGSRANIREDIVAAAVARR